MIRVYVYLVHQPFCQMNPEIPEWDIVAIQRRYDYLQLSDEQAAQVFQYEQESRAPITGGLSFTFWEEREYEWDRMKAILSGEQLALYERDWQESVGGYEASLRRTDAAEWPVEVALFEEMAGWYREAFIPGFQAEALGVPGGGWAYAGCRHLCTGPLPGVLPAGEPAIPGWHLTIDVRGPWSVEQMPRSYL
jgi:hypothetical protein